MNSFYLLSHPIEAAGPPKSWSWSSLSEWSQCPKRWWLKRCKYSNVSSSKYPSRISVASLHGILIHHALEALSQQRRAGRSIRDFNAYDAIKLKLHQELDVLNANPRTNCDTIAANFSLDKCLADFYRIAKQIYNGTQQPENTGAFDGAMPNRKSICLEEYAIYITDPPIFGILDRVTNGRVAEFKSGDSTSVFAEEHERQLQFYSVLWWLKFGQPVTGLELRYANGQVKSVPPLNDDELTIAVARIKREIAEAEASLASPPPRANPSLQNCRYCSVRHLCDEYWKNTATIPLRTTSSAVTSRANSCDIRIVDLPSTWKGGASFRGQVESKDFGVVELSIPKTKCPGPDIEHVDEIRILSASINFSDEATLISIAAHSEVFWLLPGC